VVQSPLDLPHINGWLLILAAAIASIGLNIVLPKRRRSFVSFNTKDSTKFGYNGIADEIDDEIEDVIDDIEDAIEDIADEIEEAFDYDDDDHVRRDDYDNNPRINVSFGGESRYLHADCLETVEIDCRFGGLEVYFDHAKLSPKGAKVYCDCKFGGVELYIPKEWKVIDDISVTLGAAEKSRRRENPKPDAPVLRIKGSVAFGAIEVKYI
jgi:hypothetical protein